MNTEIDLVSGFMEVDEGAPGDLQRSRQVLMKLIDEEEAQKRISSEHDLFASKRRHSWPHRSLRRRTAVVCVAAASAGALCAVALWARSPSTPAAAAQIARLADAVVPVPPLAPEHWYQYKLQGELSTTILVGHGPGGPITSTNASAIVPIAIGQWTNSNGAVCNSENLGTARFASAANAQAWREMGLVTAPSNQPATGCAVGFTPNGGIPTKPIDVTTITHDPATLASQLRNGTTGIQSVDNDPGLSAPDVGFLRLTELLVGPIHGQWSGFGQEILRTMSLLPGIVSLGTLTSHSGAQGLAFSMPAQVTLDPKTGVHSSAFTPPTVILDPQDGGLLEVRNFGYGIMTSALQGFDSAPSDPLFSRASGAITVARWIDPVSQLKVVGQSSVPAWTATFHIIEAVTAPSATASQVSGLLDVQLRLTEDGNTTVAISNVPAPGWTTYDITIVGSGASAQTAAGTLTASGLFTNVSTKL